jgi:esterase/lipase superfamily enzyme
MAMPKGKTKKGKATLPIYFGTNRNVIQRPQGVEFGPDFNQAPNPMNFGRVRGTVKLDRDDYSPSDCVIETYAAKAFDPAVRKEITGSKGALLISIHGFNYRFYEAALRTVWLSQWFANGDPGVPNTAVLFTWPSQGAFSLASYRTDVQSVQNSPMAFDLFFDELIGLIAEYRKNNPNGRVVLLAHSLGAYMLTMGLPTSLGVGPGRYDPQGKPKLFDCAILAAGDTDTDALRNPQKLQGLADVAARIALYYNGMDIPLTTFSPSVHHVARLGVDGPPDKLAFKGLPYEFVNCAAASPSDDDTGEYLDWQHHQYYRLVPEVRDDICGVMSGLAPNQMPNRRYRTKANYYSLRLA